MSRSSFNARAVAPTRRIVLPEDAQETVYKSYGFRVEWQPVDHGNVKAALYTVERSTESRHFAGYITMPMDEFTVLQNKFDAEFVRAGRGAQLAEKEREDA